MVKVLFPLSRSRPGPSLNKSPVNTPWPIVAEISMSIAALPSGTPEPADVLDAAGQILGTVEVYRTEISDIGAFSMILPAYMTAMSSARPATTPRSWVIRTIAM